MPNSEPRIAYFISSHGFGHATRACAVMAAMLERMPAARFEIFTQTPAWLFRDSLAAAFTLHSALTDVGLAQVGPMQADLPQTLRRLDEFLPFDDALVARLAEQVQRLRCAIVVCDIAPLGLAVARAARLPSVLIENFTWDWIYAEYVAEEPRLAAHIAYLQSAFASADYHLKTEPAFTAPEAAKVDLVTAPISRRPHTHPDEIRRQLGVPAAAKAVLITMGGIPEAYSFLDQLADYAEYHFVIPGSHGATGRRATEQHAEERRAVERRNNVTLLPHHSAYFHPDLVNACDAVVGKAGYSTVAETYHAGVPLGYVLRARFRESEVIKTFVEREMPGLALPAAEFNTGAWLARLPDLLAQPRRPRGAPDGAAQAAEFIGRLLSK